MQKIHMIGNAHIDPVWLWRWTEGYQEIKATFQSALDRMNETETFVFTSACADYYLWVEQNAPEMFTQIARRIREGRWIVTGGMVIQPDCNIPSGESFARHFLYSQRYFKRAFGITVKTGYNVDSFGHSGMLPQLLQKAGIENYLFMRPGVHENSALPAPLFWWRAPDGSRVLTCRIGGYGWNGGEVQKRVDEAREVARKADLPIMAFYGVGNHGGGPTIKNIQSIQAIQAQGGEDVLFSDPDRYFDEVRASGAELPEWTSDLQHHASGCYSTTSNIKRNNRLSEGRLAAAEIFSVMAEREARLTPDYGAFERGWWNVLFNQFHDIMGGCSVREAYDDANELYGEVLAIAGRAENAAIQKMSWAVDTIQGVKARLRSKETDFRIWEYDGLGTPVVVFNANSFEQTGLVTLVRPASRVTDENGVDVPVQTARGRQTNGRDKYVSVFNATVPPLGYRLYWMYMGDPAELNLKPATAIENQHIALKFDPKTGALISLFAKAQAREMLAAPARAVVVDIEHVDTWAHGVFTFDKDVGEFSDAEFTLVEDGPARKVLRVTNYYKASSLTCDYILRAGSDQVEVDARLNLQEKFVMVKLAFPANIGGNPAAHYEISYGSITKPANGEEEVGHRWVCAAGDGGALGLVNDGKYSFCMKENELRMTVANSSIFADHYGQQTRDALCEHMDIGEQLFRYALIPQPSGIDRAALGQRGLAMQQPLRWVVETYHEGTLPSVKQGVSIDTEAVALTALKRAEAGGGYIARLVELSGAGAKANVDFPLLGRKLALDFAPQEIKTVLLPGDEAQPPREVLLTEYDA